MALTQGSPCSVCTFGNPVRHWSEFLKILDRGDVGITIFRYKGSVHDKMARSGKKKETFIFYTTRKVTDRRVAMGIDIYIAEPKCINYCPRCIEMMRRIDALFKNTSDREPDLCEIFSCPPCDDLVHRFRKFTTEENQIKEHDSELIHLQRLTAPGLGDAFGTARTKFENFVQFEAKDTELTKRERADNEPGKKEAKGTDLKTKTTNIPKLSEIGSKNATGTKDKERTKIEKADKDLKAKSEKTLDQSGKDKKTKDGDDKKTKDGDDKKTKDGDDKKTKDGTDKKTKDGDDKKTKDGTDKKTKDGDDKKTKDGHDEKTKDGDDKKTKDDDKTGKKATSRSKVGNMDKLAKGKSQKSISDSKITIKTSKEQSANSDSTGKSARENMDNNPLIRMKIAEHMQAQKQRKDIDNKLSNAAKKKEEERRARALAEEARQLKFKAAMGLLAQPEAPESEDRQTDTCSDEPANKWIVKGNRLCRAASKKVLAAEPSISRGSSDVLPPPPTPNSNKTPAGPVKPHDGRLKYHLSQRKYIDNGWTLLPKEMVMRKVTLFQMHPARNEFDWLQMNRHKERMLYDSGEQLATFYENGCARVYYRSGVLALDFYQAQDKNAGGYRVVVYSNGKPVERAALHTVLAEFDYSGNGAVFDHNGRPRLKYSQNDGVVLDRSIGPYTHWRWHNLNVKGRLQTVTIDNEPLHKDPNIMSLEEELLVPRDKKKRGKSDRQGDEKSLKSSEIPGNEIEELSNDEMIMRELESQNVIKENCRLLKGFSPFQIKMKAFKINDNFSLRIIDQSSVFLTFSDGKTRLRINVGMVMDPNVVLGQDLVEVGEVASFLEKMPESESLDELQRVVRGARAAERARVLRERKLNPPVTHDPPPCNKDRRAH